MVAADLKRLFRETLDRLAHETGHTMAQDDYDRFNELLYVYGVDRLLSALESVLNEETPTFPSVDYVRSKIEILTH